MWVGEENILSVQFIKNSGNTVRSNLILAARNGIRN